MNTVEPFSSGSRAVPSAENTDPGVPVITGKAVCVGTGLGDSVGDEAAAVCVFAAAAVPAMRVERESGFAVGTGCGLRPGTTQARIRALINILIRIALEWLSFTARDSAS